MKQLARDVMSSKVIAVEESMDLRELAKLFLEQGISGAPVINADGDLSGVISQTDLIYYGLTRDDELVMDSHFYHAARVEGHHLPKGFQVEDCNTGCVADVMTPVVHSVTADETVESVVHLMTRNHIHRVIVRDGQKVAGIISALDILKVQQANSRKSATKKGRRPAAAG